VRRPSAGTVIGSLGLLVAVISLQISKGADDRQAAAEKKRLLVNTAYVRGERCGAPVAGIEVVVINVGVRPLMAVRTRFFGVSVDAIEQPEVPGRDPDGHRVGARLPRSIGDGQRVTLFYAADVLRKAERAGQGHVTSAAVFTAEGQYAVAPVPLGAEGPRGVQRHGGRECVYSRTGGGLLIDPTITRLDRQR
jgi:hypothetical protein